MLPVYVSLNSIERVRNFVNDINKIEEPATLSNDQYVIDAKSIMGIFCLDLSKPLKLEVENWKDEFAKLLEKYLIKSNT